MKTVLVTGARGFLGQNLLAALQRREDIHVCTFNKGDDEKTLEKGLAQADLVFHLAGVNRPREEREFDTGNHGLTLEILERLDRAGRRPVIVFSSSIQAALDNPYGCSKKAAEDAVAAFGRRNGSPVCIYRLPGVFGKWSRPNYNTVVATFCHNIARGLEIAISDPNRELELVYVDDVVAAFLRHLDQEPREEIQRYTVSRSFRITLGELSERIRSLHEIRHTLFVPDLSDDLMKCLHATYLSFLPEKELSYRVGLKMDDRGWLFELLKSEHFGQIFLSKTLPGISRGNHYHDTKIEKFCVIQGKGIIRFRSLNSENILEYPVNDRDIKVVDIPPGYTHSIENTGCDEMICLFWANQIFNPEKPDTYFNPVFNLI